MSFMTTEKRNNLILFSDIIKIARYFLILERITPYYKIRFFKMSENSPLLLGNTYLDQKRRQQWMVKEHVAFRIRELFFFSLLPLPKSPCHQSYKNRFENGLPFYIRKKNTVFYKCKMVFHKFLKNISFLVVALRVKSCVWIF